MITLNDLPDFLIYALISFLVFAALHMGYEHYKIKWGEAKNKEDKKKADKIWKRFSPSQYATKYIAGGFGALWVVIDVLIKETYAPYTVIIFILWLLSVQFSLHNGAVNLVRENHRKELGWSKIKYFMFGQLNMSKPRQFIGWALAIITTIFFVIIL